MPRWNAILYLLHTLILFTWADFKTIFIPITVFSCATAPLNSTVGLLKGWAWIWLHQLMCNVSNQSGAKDEDMINKPWRPIPAGRLNGDDATKLRWMTVAVCLLFSTALGLDLAFTTAGLVVTTVLYDEVGMSSHFIGKSLCNIGGYAAFEIGATKLMGESHELDANSAIAVVISAALIFTTIHAQDFPDVEGDAALGRDTFPIRAPELSRIIILFGTIIWSVFLSWFWALRALSGMLFVILGCSVGLRYYLWRSSECDARSYVIYNLWLVFAHALPISVRFSPQLST